MRAWGRKMGPGTGPEGKLCFQKNGWVLPTAPHPFPALSLSSTATSLGAWPEKEHIGGFPECIAVKVRPAPEATGGGPWAGSRTCGIPDGGKRREAVPCGKSCWQLVCVRGERQGKARGQGRISRTKTDGHRHPVTQTHKQDTNPMMPLRN